MLLGPMSQPEVISTAPGVDLARVADPDPDPYSIGSGDPDPDPGGQK
jgi:hypothetical protein